MILKEGSHNKGRKRQQRTQMALREKGKPQLTTIVINLLFRNIGCICLLDGLLFKCSKAVERKKAGRSRARRVVAEEPPESENDDVIMFLSQFKVYFILNIIFYRVFLINIIFN